MYKFIRLSRVYLNLSEFSNKCQNTVVGNSTSVGLLKQAITFLQQNAGFSSATKDTGKVAGLNEEIDVHALTQGNADQLKKLRVVILEADVMRQDGHRVPDTAGLKQHHWAELLARETRSQRHKYLEFLWRIERKKETARRKKDEARQEREQRPPLEDDGHLRYGLNHNTFLIRIYESTMNQLYNAKLVNAMQFGQPLVLDCGYDASMSSRECTNAARQLLLSFSENRMHADPFDLHLCNAVPNAASVSALHRHIPQLWEPWFPLHVHTHSYLDLYPRDRLVYLTPHCRNDLKHYDHDAVYIVGAIVDKVNNEPLSLAKAKREGLRMARLPLDRHLQWGSGSGKSLTVNQVVSIMLDAKCTGDWDYALRHVPRRKLSTDDDHEMAAPTMKREHSFRPAFRRSGLFLDRLMRDH